MPSIVSGVSVVALLAVVIMFTSDVFSELTVKVCTSLNVDDQKMKHQTSEVNAEESNREWRHKIKLKFSFKVVGKTAEGVKWAVSLYLHHINDLMMLLKLIN